MPEVLTFDAVVVGAGPAGSSAALALARAGRSVVLVERGPFPGAKNVYGGVVYGRVLDDIVPNWWEEVPVERWVVRRSTMMMTGTQSLSVDFRTDAWGSAPYNGMTTLRSHFDAWLAGKATGAGARLVTSTVATGLVRDGSGRVVGVRTDREGAELHAPVVVACDGVNSFLAKEAGLLRPDFVLEDISLALMANEGIHAESPAMRVAASRRFAALMIQSFQANPGPAPLPPAVRLPLSRG